MPQNMQQRQDYSSTTTLYILLSLCTLMAPASFPLILRGTREESETDVYSIHILRNQKFIIGLDSFPKVFRNILFHVSNILLNFAK